MKLRSTLAGLSRRTKWTIVVLLGFVLLGVVSGLVNQRVGNDFSLDSLDEEARSIVQGSEEAPSGEN